MQLKLGALIGGAAGVVAAGAAAGLASQHRRIGRQRSDLLQPQDAQTLAFTRQRQVLTSDGIALHVEEIGPREAAVTVLFVHGFTLNLQSFLFQRRAVLERFGPAVRMVLFDLRSHGRSQVSPHEGCTMAQLGEDLDSVITEVIPDGSIVVVGHSMGGMSVMALAQSHPELFAPNSGGEHPPIAAVALLNTSFGDLKMLTLGLPPFLARLGAPVLPFALRRAARNVSLIEKARVLTKDLAWVITKRLSFASPDVPAEIVSFATTMIAATRVDVVAAFFADIISHDGTRGIQALAATDVLVIGATQDAMIPVKHSEQIAAALPRSTLVLVPEAGHLLMLEQPAAVNDPLLELIESVLAVTPR